MVFEKLHPSFLIVIKRRLDTRWESHWYFSLQVIVKTFTYQKTFPIVRMYFSMLNIIETKSKTLKWTIICNISQLYSQALLDELHY